MSHERNIVVDAGTPLLAEGDNIERISHLLELIADRITLPDEESITEWLADDANWINITLSEDGKPLTTITCY